MRTKNGCLMIGAAGEAIWQRCAEALGHLEWCEDPWLATNRMRMANRDALEEAMEAVLATGTHRALGRDIEAAGLPCGPVYNYAQMFADPQVRHRGLIQNASDLEVGEVPHLRTPIRIGVGVPVRTVAPKLGQHNAEVFGGAALARSR
jgi:CoA:oxalate CoA-transferase